MHIKQFKATEVRVKDPLRPGKVYFETHFTPTKCGSVSVAGVEYRVEDGADFWIDVPHDVGAHLRSFRGPRGEKFYTPEEVDEEVGVGRIKAEEATKPPEPPVRVEAPDLSGESFEPPIAKAKPPQKVPAPAA